MKKYVFFTTFLLILSAAKAQETGKMKDERDNKSYNTVKIGDQIWMAENLNYDAGEGSICYKEKDENCDKYGRFYTAEALDDVCPDGWHLPSDDEWKELEIHLGMKREVIDDTKWRGEKEGHMLKSEKGWVEEGNGSNSTGFNALSKGLYMKVPPSARHLYDRFIVHGKVTGFWSSTSVKDKFWVRVLRHDKKGINRTSMNPDKVGVSVRCVKD